MDKDETQHSKVKIDKSVIEHLTKLSRIKCTDAEQEKLAEDLNSILSYVSKLEEIDTQDLAPLSYIFEGQIPYLREDEVKETLSRDEFLKNVPDKTAGLVRFPEVIKSNT